MSDHAKSAADAVKLAHKLGIDVPTSTMPSQIWELKVVAAMKGATFNRWYSSLEVYGHVQDIQETTDEVVDGTNSQIRDDAKTELPILKMHLKLARAAFTAAT